MQDVCLEKIANEAGFVPPTLVSHPYDQITSSRPKSLRIKFGVRSSPPTTICEGVPSGAAALARSLAHLSRSYRLLAKYWRIR